MRARKKIMVLNRVREEREPMEEAMRKILVEAFSEDVKKLGMLLNRDLSHWML